MISEVLIVLLIGEYTEFPAWLPADPGSGIALFNSTEGAEPFAHICLPGTQEVAHRIIQTEHGYIIY